ncbi:MAG: polyprenyl diphosphate synthase [Conexivisphaerales archaeon]|jgi:tritrans,polycis-undecaprenyl-diphosphate synthase [geranylgeranyl-diphosphate specific]
MRVDGLLDALLKDLGVYRFYTRRLSGQVKESPRPRHIGVILDGNRRWAEANDYPKWVGYSFGADKVENLMTWCLEYGVKALTIYALSTENLARPREELEIIFSVIGERLDKLLTDGSIQKHRVKVNGLGDLSLVPQGIGEKVLRLEEMSAAYDSLYLNIAIAYGGRMEIVDAVKRLARDVERGVISPSKIDEKAFSGYLFTSDLPDPDPDLIIRTSGELRLSGFLLWQSAYSELVFMDVYWPGFRKLDFLRAIRTYQLRQRRFGR